MGDFAPPKRKDVFDRLRRRLELYRRHQNGVSTSYDNSINTIYEQQRHDTLIHRQRWLDSKAKKASKQKPKADNTSSSSSATHGGVERNPVVTQKLKRKIDGSQPENSEAPDESEPSAAKSQINANTTGFNVSVHIQGQKNNTNVNVNVRTTVETTLDNATNVEATTSVECKREPQEEHSDSESGNASEILQPNELEDILLSLTKDKETPSDAQLLEELKRFEEIYQSKISDDSNNSNDDKMYPGMTSTSPGLQKPPPSGFDQQSSFDGSQNFPVRSPAGADYRGTPSSLAETGPAAQTLKQMAAQHQNMHTDAFTTKGMDPYSGATMRSNSYPGQNGFQNYDQNQYIRRDQYMPPQNMNNMHMQQYPQNKADPSLTYNGTKPLTHYQPQPGQQPPPSSLQQLQDQVAHFTNSQQIELTQTQHVQVTDGAHQMHISQSQMLQMRPPPQHQQQQQQQISMSQRQNLTQMFSMPGANMGPNPQQSQYAANEQMKNQMMHEKMRRERQAQARSLLEEQHQLQQQYTNRPPPEYKMQHSAPEGYHSATMGPNPLQTMQNMVNSTNTMPPSQYGPIKSENSQMTMHNGMMQSQMMSMQRMNSAGGATPDMCQGGQAYQTQAIQRQQSFPGAQLSAAQTKVHRPPEPTYTSAIMRNQRPPNVNVGPDGLNISQPRNQHEWPRPMMPTAARQPVPTSMAGAGMMQYHYGNQNGMMTASQIQGMQMRQQRPNMQMSAMHSQAAMMQGTAQTQMMMQQQNMQMSQRTMGARNSAPQPGMLPDSQITGGASQSDDIMNLWDSTAQNSNPELIDSITVQSSDANNDAAWLDEILGGK